MKGGSSLVVRATTDTGTEVTDTYSLTGVSAALAASDSGCD